MQSRSHGSSLPTAPCQMVARRAGRSLERKTTTTWVVKGSAVSFSATGHV